MPNGSYSWLLLTDGIAQLAQRLAIDFTGPNTPFWTASELRLYIFRALQQYNIYTNCWKTDFTYNPTELWNSLGLLAGSPRQRTATDTQSLTMLQYYLLEPPSGGMWTGTTQFSL